MYEVSCALLMGVLLNPYSESLYSYCKLNSNILECYIFLKMCKGGNLDCLVGHLEAIRHAH